MFCIIKSGVFVKDLYCGVLSKEFVIDWYHLLWLVTLGNAMILRQQYWTWCPFSTSFFCKITFEGDVTFPFPWRQIFKYLHLKLYTRCVHVWVLTLNNDIYHNGFANMIKGNPSVQLWNKLCILLCAVSQYWIIVQSNNDRNVKCSL